MTKPNTQSSPQKLTTLQVELAKMMAEFNAQHNVKEFTESEKAELLKQPMQATFPQGKSPKMRQQESQKTPKK